MMKKWFVLAAVLSLAGVIIVNGCGKNQQPMEPQLDSMLAANAQMAEVDTAAAVGGAYVSLTGTPSPTITFTRTRTMGPSLTPTATCTVTVTVTATPSATFNISGLTVKRVSGSLYEYSIRYILSADAQLQLTIQGTSGNVQYDQTFTPGTMGGQRGLNTIIIDRRTYGLSRGRMYQVKTYGQCGSQTDTKKTSFFVQY